MSKKKPPDGQPEPGECMHWIGLARLALDEAIVALRRSEKRRCHELIKKAGLHLVEARFAVDLKALTEGAPLPQSDSEGPVMP
jgi:hypothetical protein